VTLPALEDVVVLPEGRYTLGEPGEERVVELRSVEIARWPVTAGHGPLADHPLTGVTLAGAEAFCARASEVLGRRVRLPTGDEWEALARGTDGRPWPWGDVFDERRCNCAEAGWGWTVPVTAHPDGAGPFGAEQLVGNVWEWVAGLDADGWARVRGGSYLDHAWGVRCSRALPADPARATATTGFRIAIDEEES